MVLGRCQSCCRPQGVSLLVRSSSLNQDLKPLFLCPAFQMILTDALERDKVLLEEAAGTVWGTCGSSLPCAVGWGKFLNCRGVAGGVPTPAQPWSAARMLWSSPAGSVAWDPARGELIVPAANRAICWLLT